MIFFSIIIINVDQSAQFKLILKIYFKIDFIYYLINILIIF